VIPALVAGGAAALALIALIAYLVHAALAAADRAAAAEVARAGVVAQLEIARANVATARAALDRLAETVAAYKELARAQPPLPGLAAGAHGVDQLLAAIDDVRRAMPAEPAAGADRSAGDGGRLPGGAGADGEPVDAGGPATVPEA
jgi:hypothetical protein